MLPVKIHNSLYIWASPTEICHGKTRKLPFKMIVWSDNVRHTVYGTLQPLKICQPLPVFSNPGCIRDVSVGSLEPIGCIRAWGYKTFFMLKSSEHEIFPANIKMPTIIGILIFISRKNFMLSSALQEKGLSWWFLIFYKQNKFHSQLSWAWKKFYNLGPRLVY